MYFIEIEKKLGSWTNDGDCEADGDDHTCGPGTQKQKRTCTDGTTNKCTTEDIEQMVSCTDAKTALPNCLKQFGAWLIDGACVATAGGNCGPGTQDLTRTCEDGTVDKCTAGDKMKTISCEAAGTALPDCAGKP